MNQSSKLWTGSFVGICLVNFFIFVNFHALLPTFPFFVTYLGGDAQTIGLATALFSIASIISRPFAGRMVDTTGRRTVLTLGLIGMALMPMGYFFAAGIASAIVLRTAHGLFHAASSNASASWVADIVPPQRMGEGIGMYGLSMAISTAVAPAAGLALMHAFGFRPLFGLATLMAVVALIIGLSIGKRDYTLDRGPLRWRQLFERRSLPAAVTQFFYMMSYGVIEVYVAIYAESCGLPGAGIYFIFIALATIITRLVMGRRIDRCSESLMEYGGNLTIILGILLLVLVHTTPAYLLSAILLGHSFGTLQPALQTMAMRPVPSERRGAAGSTFFVAFDLGIALGGYLAGLLVKHYSYDTMFLWMIVPCLASAASYRLATHRR